MNILFISNLFPPEVVGGAEKHAKIVAQELSARNHEVDVIATGADAPRAKFTDTTQNGVTIHRIQPLNMYAPYNHQDAPTWTKPIQHLVDQWNPFHYLIFKSKIHDLKPDLVHVHNYAGLSKSLFSVVGQIDVPVVHTTHDYRALHLRPNLFDGNDIIAPGRLMRVYQLYNDKIIGSNIDKLLSPSQFVIDLHQEEGVFNDVPAECIQLGIKTNAMQREQTVENNSAYRLLYVGQLTYSKGIDILIKAVEKISNPNLECHVLGKGPARDSLERIADEDNRITLHGFVSEDELARQYALADYTVVPSRWYDNSPMVIYESFARHTPVIGADIGGIPELISDDQTGYLFEPENPAALATKIRGNKARAEEMSRTVEQVDISLESHVDKLIEIYNRLL